MHVFKKCFSSSSFCHRSESNLSWQCQKYSSAMIVVCMALSMSLGVSWIYDVRVPLFTRVCIACLSSPVNIIFICFHPFLVWSEASTSMSRFFR